MFQNIKNIVFTGAIVATIALTVVSMAMPPAGANADGASPTTETPVPQTLVTVHTEVRCEGETSLLTATVDNDYWFVIGVDIGIDGDNRFGTTINAGEAIHPEFNLGQSHPAGEVQITVTYNDGGLGIFTVNEPFDGNDCLSAEVPAEIVPSDEPYAIERDNDDVYVSPPSTVPAPVVPKPIAFTG